ncbi:sensor domain-containing diguanylate cyclase [Amycolatopsis suaedae]|uniref:GGDEF domain-containing protein n=1 Tax=Amycolatopsis suaedae TaxID=2510978 RepID=UPI0013EF56A7|nr:GGDEF domain-containing protein [Amycolatopsis suaedae]
MIKPRWKVWTLPPPVLTYLLIVEVTALAATALLAFVEPVHGVDLLYGAALIAGGLGFAEITRRVERLRKQFADTPHVNMSSVWTLSAALLVPPVLAAVVTVVLYTHVWLRTWRYMAGHTLYRAVFNTCVVLLSCYAAAGVAHLLPGDREASLLEPAGLLWLAAILTVYWVVNSGVVAVVIALASGERTLSRLLGTRSENGLECATLCVGALVAVLLGSLPWLAPLVFPPLYVLHRSVLVRQLEYAATVDQKTGLLNAATWKSLATKEFGRAAPHGTPVALLMIDLDHFKTVNDTYGHLVGDEALREVAGVLRREVRAYDLCGRFGGEEFVLLLTDTTADHAVAVAERIRAAVRELRLTDVGTGEEIDGLRLSISVGVAVHPDAGDDLEEVLLAADNAMFVAKDSGRDQVRTVAGRA